MVNIITCPKSSGQIVWIKSFNEVATEVGDEDQSEKEMV